MEKSIEILTENIDKIAQEQDFQNYKMNIKSKLSYENTYTKFLYQVAVTSPGKDDLELYVKVAAPDLTMRANLPFFQVEYFFYENLLRKYKQLEEKNNIPIEHRLVTPKLYHGSDEYLKEILVLEDLTSKGFTRDDKLNINWEYASKSLENLAKFHALSIAMSEDDPEYFQNLTTFLGNFDFTGLESIIGNILTTAFGVVKEENQSYLKIIYNEIFKAQERNQYYTSHRRPFIIHGNYEPSNLIHRIVDGHMEVIAFNYQMLSLGNPIVDIVYLIFIGSNKKFRDQYFKQCLEHYYEELCKALERFGLDPDEIYSREDFDYEVEQVLPLGLMQSLCTVMLLLFDQDIPLEFNEFNLEEFAPSQNALYVERVNETVDEFIKMGCIKLD